MYQLILHYIPAWLLAVLATMLVIVFIYRQACYSNVIVKLPTNIRINQIIAAFLVGAFEAYVQWGAFTDIVVPAAFSRIAILAYLLSSIQVQVWIIRKARKCNK